MSEAIKIKEGGVDRSQNQTNKLKTNTVGGGVCFWVPETERQTDDKRITENGTYTAEHDGLYGYDEINVSVPNTGSMSGKGTDGNDYSITVDDNGYIVETKIPSAIRIETLPAQLLYTEGDTIDYSGIVVGAYDAQGNRMQEVPYGELIFLDSTAHSDGDGTKGSSDFESLSGLVPIDFSYTAIHAKKVPGGDEQVWAVAPGTAITAIQAHDVGTVLRIKASATPAEGLDQTIEHNGYRVYYSAWQNMNDYTDVFPVVRTSQRGNSIYSAVAWTMIYGDITSGGIQKLTVQWNRPTDNVPLDDYFEISVNEASTESGSAHGNEGGFEGGGSEHGF